MKLNLEKKLKSIERQQDNFLQFWEKIIKDIRTDISDIEDKKLKYIENELKDIRKSLEKALKRRNETFQRKNSARGRVQFVKITLDCVQC